MRIATLNRAKTAIKKDIQIRDLKSWHKSHYPVFLIFVDTSQNIAYWRYIDPASPIYCNPKHEYVNVAIPLKSKLNAKGFLDIRLIKNQHVAPICLPPATHSAL